MKDLERPTWHVYDEGRVRFYSRDRQTTWELAPREAWRLAADIILKCARTFGDRLSDR